jgi:hypothetical protein
MSKGEPDWINHHKNITPSTAHYVEYVTYTTFQKYNYTRNDWFIKRILENGNFQHNVAYLFKAWTVDPEKQPLLGNAHNVYVAQEWRNCLKREVTCTAVAIKQLGKHVSATSQGPTM